ncbi:MAG TPA: hypothetical protein VF517_07820 [Thermoleophilaceae bacterium]|jgi:hypothetical protein
MRSHAQDSRVRRQKQLFICLAAVLALAITASAVALGGPSKRARPKAPNVGAAKDTRAAARAADRRDARRAARRAKQLRTPAARRARMRSRSAYGDLHGAATIRLARRNFAEVVARPVWKGLESGNGQRVRRYLNDFTAELEGGSDPGRPAIASSTVPLRTRNASGQAVPVNLTLEPSDDGYAPQAPIVSTRIARRAPGGVSLGSEPIGVRPAGAADVEGSVVSDRVLYPDSAVDTDFIVEPADRGAQVMWQLRSQESPEKHALELDLPNGAKLRQSPQVASAVEVVRGGKLLAFIYPPAAFDADGTQVPVKYAIAGDTVTLDVEHRGADVHYPLLVDPYINVYEDFYDGTWTNSSHAWWASGNGDMNYAAYTFALHLSAKPWVWYSIDQYMGWYWQAPLNSFIYRYDLANIFWYRATWEGSPAGCNSKAQHGLWTGPGYWGWEGGNNAFHQDPTCETDKPDYGLPAICTSWNCDPNAGTNQNYAFAGLSARRDGTGNSAFMGLSRVILYLRDRYEPRVLSTSQNPTLQDAISNSRWLPGGVMLASSPKGTDWGLGLGRFELVQRASGRKISVFGSEGNPRPMWCDFSIAAHDTDPWPNPYTDRGGDKGDRNHRCASAQTTPYSTPPDSQTASTTFDYSSDHLDEGVNPYGVDAFDIIGTKDSTVSSNWTVKVDRSIPESLALSGPMTNVWAPASPQPIVSTDANDRLSGVKTTEFDIAAMGDKFERTSTNGWGDAVNGGPWTVNDGPASDFLTESGAGKINFPSGGGYRRATLHQASHRDYDYSGRIKMQSATTGQAVGSFAYFTMRRQANGEAYRVGLVGRYDGLLHVHALNGAGSLLLDVNTGLGFTPGAWYRVRTQVEGSAPTQIRVKVWRDGQPEPGAWQYTAQDSAGPLVAGGTGVQVNGGSTSAQPFYFDDLQALDLGQRQVKESSNPACGNQGCINRHQTSFQWNPTGFAEGAHEYVVRAKDPLGYTRSETRTVKLDRTFPNAPQLSNTLWDKRGTFIKAGTYPLTISASDGNGTNEQSGIEFIRVYVDDPDQAAGTFVELSSSGAAVSGCTASGCPPTNGRPFVLDTAAHNIKEGERTIRVTAIDRAGNPRSTEFKVKFDKFGPAIEPGGPMYTFAQAGEVPNGNHTLTVTATENDPLNPNPPKTARSGSKSIEVFLNGDSIFYDEMTCPAGNCSMTRSTNIDTTEMSSGPHDVEIVSTDQLDNTSTRTFTFRKSCCFGAPTPWGTFSSSTYDLQYADVTGATEGADAITRHKLTGLVQVAPALPGGGFGAPVTWGTWTGATFRRPVDVTGDGRRDLVGLGDGGSIMVGRNLGSAFAPAEANGAWNPALDLHFADLDGDGTTDLVGRDSTGSVTASYFVEGRRLNDFVFGTFSSAYSLDFADVDGDDMADAVGRDSAGNIRVARSEGGYFEPASTWATRDPARYTLAFGDVNGDTMDDLVVRDNSTTAGDVMVAPSDGDTFSSSPAKWATWDKSYEFNLVEANGDGRKDIIGRDAAGVVRASLSNATPPAPENADVDTDEALTDVAVQQPAAPVQTGCQAMGNPTPTTASTPANRPALAFQDDRHLLDRGDLVTQAEGDPFTPSAIPGGAEETAVQRINHIYNRMRQAGANTVRFNVYWGRHEYRRNATNTGWDGPAGQRWYWEDPNNKLDKAINLAACNGFRVLLTLTGTLTGLDCEPGYSGVAARGCEPAEGGTGRATGYDPKPEEYREFVRAAVEHFTVGGVRAQYFSVWNEPNHGQWLDETNGAPPDKRVTHTRYGQLYGAGYAGWFDAGQPAGTRMLIGELSSKPSPGKKTGCNGTAGSCPYTAMEYLQLAAASAKAWMAANVPAALINGTTVPAHGFAHHPYQHTREPWDANWRKEEVGIAKLYAKTGTRPTVARTLGLMCGTKSGNMCTGAMGSPSGGRTPMYLTEFSYFNRPGGDYKQSGTGWYFEGDRGKKFRSVSTKKPGALELAYRARAQMMLIYQVIEYPPSDPSQRDQDYGILGPPLTAPPDQDITGNRSYGRRYSDDPTFFPDGRQIKRVAYCKIRAWATDKTHVYFNKTDPIYANSCTAR